jgi:hypothetical protein
MSSLTCGGLEATHAGPGTVTGPIAVYGHPARGYCGGRGTVIGGVLYRGEAIRQLAGKYLLRDYCTSELWALTIEDGRVVDGGRMEPPLRNLVSFGTDGHGEVYAVSASNGVYRLVPAAR